MALEKAISSSVRLCVVAPTVNVHVNDKKVSMMSSVSEQSLKVYLSDLLQSYNFVYRQDKPDISPDGVSLLQDWLQSLLTRMQASIEQHIYAALGEGVD